MNRIKRLTEVAREVYKDLGLSNNNEIHFITDERGLEEIKNKVGELDYQAMTRKGVKGYAVPGHAFILLYKTTNPLLQLLDDEYVVTHELRHLWQFESGFRMDNAFVPYRYRVQEVDACKYAIDRMKVKANIVKGVACAVELGVGVGIGLLIKKALNNK